MSTYTMSKCAICYQGMWKNKEVFYAFHIIWSDLENLKNEIELYNKWIGILVRNKQYSEHLFCIYLVTPDYQKYDKVSAAFFREILQGQDKYSPVNLALLKDIIENPYEKGNYGLGSKLLPVISRLLQSPDK